MRELDGGYHLLMATTPTTVDEYIVQYPVEVRSILERIRALIHRLATKPVLEQIKYGMPAFAIEGRHTIYVAAWKKHVGFYAVNKAPSARSLLDVATGSPA